MAGTIEESHRVALLALAALKDLGLQASPRNIELWLSHTSGANPALSGAIQDALGENGTLTQFQLDEIYVQHIARIDLSQDVIDVVKRFEEEVNALSALIESSGQSAHGRGEQLQNLSTQLRQSAEDFPSISDVLERVISITKSVREENRALEERLHESSQEIAVLRENVEHIQQEAMTDPLTGARNRKSFDISIANLIKEAKAQASPLTLIMADVDHFKKFNDRWGHQTGDQVLRLVADVMIANLKGSDVLSRYGGEEFAVLLPNTPTGNAEMLADRIRRQIESRRLRKRRTNEDLGAITMSMGVAELEADDSAETLIERADDRLYEAKRNGRNMVVGENAASGATPKQAAS